MWHSILCPDSSYVWDLVPAHLVIMFAPGFWTPKIRVWQFVCSAKSTLVDGDERVSGEPVLAGERNGKASYLVDTEFYPGRH
jgi:hypothetical protein